RNRLLALLFQHELLIQYPFVRRVLVDQVHPGWPFRHNITRAHLPYHAQRWQGPWSLRKLHRYGRPNTRHRLLLIVSIYFSAFWQPELCLIVAVLSAPPRIVIRKFQPQLIALGCLLSSFPAMSLDKTSCRIRLIPLSRRILFCITFLCAERVLACRRN